MPDQTFDSLIGPPHFGANVAWIVLCKFSVAELADKRFLLMR